MKIQLSFATLIFIAVTSYAQQNKIKDKPATQIEAVFPLYVIDGLAKHPKDSIENGKVLIDIDPDKIESMEVLKGASTALYGEDGKNGVILITTKDNSKKGKTQKE